MSLISRFIDRARAWARGRSWLWRAPVLVYLAYAGLRSFGELEYRSLFSGITLAFHEIGHILFSPFGHFLMVAGGSFAQLAIPLVAGLLLLRGSDYFGFAVGGAWLGLSAIELAWYIADARALALPLLSLGAEAEHDWFYLLSVMGWLRFDAQIAGLMRGAGAMALALSLWLGAWLCLVMARSRRVGAAAAPDPGEGVRFRKWFDRRGSGGAADRGGGGSA